MRVDVEDVLALYDERKRINQCPLRDIEWYEKGVKLTYSETILRGWQLTGLSNVDFIVCGLHAAAVKEKS